MKVRALPIIALVLASGSVQAQNDSESMVNPIADMNPATLVAVPMKMMVEMMAIPMNMMTGMMTVPMKMMEGVMVAPNAMMTSATLLDPMAIPQQIPEASYVVPAYGTPGAPAQAAPGS